MKKAIYIVIGHKSFNTGKSALVEITEEREFITQYVDIAKEKFCKQIGMNADEVSVLNWFFDQNIAIIK